MRLHQALGRCWCGLCHSIAEALNLNDPSLLPAGRRPAEHRADGTTAIHLPGGHVTLIDTGDWELVKDYLWRRTERGYVRAVIRGEARATKNIRLHRLILGYPPFEVDHINGDRLDNRRCNLRIATTQQNQANRRRLNRNNTSGVTGVRRAADCDRWMARIMVNQKPVFLGMFKTFEEAKAARLAAEDRLLGEFSPNAAGVQA